VLQTPSVAQNAKSNVLDPGLLQWRRFTSPVEDQAEAEANGSEPNHQTGGEWVLYILAHEYYTSRHQVGEYFASLSQ